MKIITALSNEILNKELNKINEYEIVAPDIQYQDGVIEILEEKSNIDLLILSEILQGDFSIYEFINEIRKRKKELKIIIILENRNEELKNFLISKGIFDIYYNNEITVQDIINLLKNKNNIIDNNSTHNLEINKVIKYKLKNKSKLNKKSKKECIIISILGSHESGKSIFAINFAKNIKNKKVLLIDFDILFNSIHSILGIKKYPFKNNKNINLENIIIKLNKNLHLISGIDILFPNKITNNDIKELLNKLKNKYDYIIIDTSSECFLDVTRFLIRYSNQCIFLLEANILEIKKAKNLLSIYIEKWNLKKDKINIVINKYNKNAIAIDLLKVIFSDFRFLGKINYDINYNLLINKNFKMYIKFKEIKNQYKIINKNLSIKMFENKLKYIGEKIYGNEFIRK